MTKSLRQRLNPGMAVAWLLSLAFVTSGDDRVAQVRPVPPPTAPRAVPQPPGMPQPSVPNPRTPGTMPPSTGTLPRTTGTMPVP